MRVAIASAFAVVWVWTRSSCPSERTGRLARSSADVCFRPNVEFAYGELTTQFAVNLEGVYRLSQTMPRSRWSPYAGGGPTLGLSHRGFSAQRGDGRSFDFGDYDFNGGVNLLAGVEKPGGVFIELKATIYADPHVRMIFGVTF